ncbi:P-loop containing nucleoside triphosphate hydrolase protein [Marasmius fiardii PR-910]|nr:P-loop containing nucleoside triphosphate hydrolase protein [Marasmius fiardii PR-910]
MQLDPTFSSLKRRTSDHAGYATAVKYARADHSSRHPTSSSSSRTMQTPSSSSTPSRGSKFKKTKPSRPQASRTTGFGLRSEPTGGKGGKGKALVRIEGPIQDEAYIESTYGHLKDQIKPAHYTDPKSAVNNIAIALTGSTVEYTMEQVSMLSGKVHVPMFRVKARVNTDPEVIGVGDAKSRKQAGRLASLSLMLQMQEQNLISASSAEQKIKLSDGSEIDFERAKDFMGYYCRRYRFGHPDVTVEEGKQGWSAVMTVAGQKIGMGLAPNKKGAQHRCYLDVVRYLDECDPELWKSFLGQQHELPKMRLYFSLSHETNNAIRDLIVDLKNSTLYRNRPSQSPTSDSSTTTLAHERFGRTYHVLNPRLLGQKSQQLLDRRQKYLNDPATERMRNTRAALPVHTRSDMILSTIEQNDVTILMAATGSGKSTQVPQIILDSYIERGEGARCNIVCTQPRRIAAISVADRVAKERNETLGRSIGYEVRFEGKPPEEHGSVNFCTVGLFLKKLQSALSEGGRNSLDDVTHLVVDEVHERDVDTDLLLVVLKRLLADRKAREKPIKIILMSATIDPTLFQQYFMDDEGRPAKVVEVPGRAFPVERHFLDDFLPAIVDGQAKWVLQDDPVAKYLIKQLEPSSLPPSVAFKANVLGKNLGAEPNEDNDLPYSLIAATIAHVMQKSDSGHVLTFLPGWDDITAVQKILLGSKGPLNINFNDTSKYAIHVLHSSIPLSEQQVIFDPPPKDVRRIILSTNIAETSVTIPDVVYVVDTGRIKEQRYDPQTHMSSLVSAWVGSSNLNQRAGRAGRHRPGEYYGILSRDYASKLQTHQTVEMSRVDLSNVVMHVKALNFPGMTVEEVLARMIEPPPSERVTSAVNQLQMLGALNENKELTSLGRVLLQIPVDVQVGRLLAYGSFFRCLDQALSLAAILTNREPFLNPMHAKDQARAKKNSFCPPGVASDALTTLEAYKQWQEKQSRGHWVTANQFCIDNFLSKPTLLLIDKLKNQLLLSLHRSGIIGVSAGGELTSEKNRMPPELNENGGSIPLLQALIASSQQPKHAVRISDRILRTQQDKMVMVHPSSVNYTSKKHVDGFEHNKFMINKQIYAFGEKRQNLSTTTNTATFIVNSTRLEPLIYMLFGAYSVKADDQGVLCDDWIIITGNLDALDDVRELKRLVDACMLRVYEGILMTKRHNRENLPVISREESEFDDTEGERNLALSPKEMRELDYLSRDLVKIMNKYHEERRAAESRSQTPNTPPRGLGAFPPMSSSGYSTPLGMRTAFNSRASTPVGRLRHSRF